MDPPQATQFSSAITTHVDGPGASAAETTTKYCERCVELNRKVFISRKENFPTKRARPTHAIEDSTLDPLCAFCCQCRAFMVSLHITHIRLGIRDAKSFEVHYDDFQQQCNGYRDIFVQRRPFLHDGSPRTRQAILQLKSPHHPDYGAGADYLGKSHIWVDPLAGYRHAFAATIKRIAHLSLLKRPPDPTGFSPRRFIDCKLGKLCEDEGQYYICLSYVWGKASTLELDSPNPAVNGLPQTLPTTVADAMAVTLSLRHRYIWVDRYCIDQNNASEVHATIQGMNSICT